ncbi:MAG: bifunctional riboflavin kinase/FAD synthetase [Anaerolineae bacterium]
MTEIITDIYATYLNRPSVLTLGSFDGVHRGHQHLLNSVMASARAQGAASIAVSLSPHPRHVLRPDVPLSLISTLDERLNLLAQLGLDYVVVFPFTLEHSQIPAREFAQLLVDHLHMAELQCGPNFALGYKREGNIPYLRRLGAEMGFAVTIVEPRQFDEGIISSTRLRNLVSQGDIQTATALLGRYPTLRSLVVHGDHRGRTLGYPTANLNVPDKKIVPANGIYAVRVRLGNQWLNGAANIGIRPQFGGGPRRVEVYILDFDRDIYGQEMEVHFVERLRDEMKFESVQALVDQMGRDVAQARAILTSLHVPPLKAALEETPNETVRRD